MENESFLEGNGIIILILFFLLMGGGFGGFGNNRPYATQEDVFNASTQNGINAKLDGINQSINTSMFQNMQSFANTNQALNTGIDSINANLNQLGYQMSQCCCDLKSQILNDKYEAVQRDLANASNIISNQTQSQYILSQLGRFVPYSSTTTTSTGA